MSLKIYHLRFSQCERIVWLCEELNLLDPDFKYDLIVYNRGLPDTPQKQHLLSMHPLGTSPLIVDSTVSPPITLTESQAILEYIINTHGKGRFAISSTTHTIQIYADYLFWLSFANGSFQTSINSMILAHAVQSHIPIDVDITTSLSSDMAWQYLSTRIPAYLKLYDDRLAHNQYLAGDEFTAADMMNIYGLTTMRALYPIDLTDFPNILRWLKAVTGRPAYRTAMQKAEDGFPACVAPTLPRLDFMMMAGWKSWSDVPEWQAHAEAQR